jgi:hypothetical protein
MKKYLLLDKEGWPVELIKGHPIINIIRRLLFGRMLVLKDWYEKTTGIKVA